MQRITKRAFVLLALIIAFTAGIVILTAQFSLRGAAWASSKYNNHVYTYGAISSAGTIYDRGGVALAETVNGSRKYAGSASLRTATLHAVGDTEGFISSGAHSSFRQVLSGYDRINGMYELIKYGKGGDVTLTIDSALCKTAWSALNGRKGTVGVYNYKTGEVVCMVSSPSYDPLSKPRNIDSNEKYEAVYLNRLLHGVFTPGSTFKVVTAACALQNIPDIEQRQFKCDGRYATGEGYVTCRAKHGTLNFEKAMNVSCNSVFSQLAVELGEAKLRASAEGLGFNQAIKADGITQAVSKFQKTPMNALELGWTGVGQHTTLANPCQMLELMGAIANEGNGVPAKLVKSLKTPSGISRPFGPLRQTPAITIDPSIARRLRTLLRSNVTATYDKNGGNSGLQLCGKTGTAEVDGKQPHAWFVGFSMNSATPYAVVVVGENAGSGQEVAYEIAVKVMREAVKL
ncbi:MAG: penicillin-binding transpeptidase domain-containing protein [Oscillospiraceae bacterium]|nr:penicillin-binding transpeptidase domain-containing protein [Oscillospiraceae bacterium]